MDGEGIDESSANQKLGMATPRVATIMMPESRSECGRTEAAIPIVIPKTIASPIPATVNLSVGTIWSITIRETGCRLMIDRPRSP